MAMRHDGALNREGGVMSIFGTQLIESLEGALAHAKGESPATVHTPGAPREVRLQAKLTRASDSAPGGMSATGYHERE